MSSPDATVDLNEHYRPHTLDEVLGDGRLLRSIEQAVEGKQRQFIFYGAPGTGKTTLAWIVARALGCANVAIHERDAGQFSTKAETKALIEMGSGGGIFSRNRAFILNEVHALRKDAWNALLTFVEKPPLGVHLIFSTTEFKKIPEAMVSRCHSYQTKPVDVEKIEQHLLWIRDEENFEASDEICRLCAKSAGGCVRKAVVLLSQCRSIIDKGDAASVLNRSTSENEISDLARMMLNGDGMENILSAVGGMQGFDGESARIDVVNYWGSVLRGVDTTDDVRARAASLMECFVYDAPFSQPTADSQFVLGVHRAYLSDQQNRESRSVADKGLDEQ